jgi:diguanylate cyclase (GGDEF)-like protein/PAS domain S-box-containing protein
MKPQLRALIVASSEDGELLCAHLDRAGYDVVATVVDTRDSMDRALRNEKWDLILSEYSIPNFGCLAALALLRERQDDTPLLLVSERIDTEVAIEAMKAGAHDCISRESPDRLAASVERERNETRMRRRRRSGQRVKQEAEARLQEALLEGANRFRAVAEVSDGFIYEWDIQSGSVGWFGDIDEELGHAPGEFPRTRDAWKAILHPEDHDRLSAAVDRHLKTGEPFYEEYRVRRKDGAVLTWNDSGKVVPDSQSNPTRWIGVVTDSTEGRQAKKKIKYFAIHDTVTGLPNRLVFNDRLTVALAQAKRSQQKLAVLLFDLDRFNAINESLGYQLGDRFLCHVAERIRAGSRAGDTVARFGGDEFAILIQRLRSEEDAAKVAQKVLEAIRLPFSIDERELFITTSIGASVYPTDGSDVETLSRNAAAALRRAKEHGRDNYQLYSPEMNARAAEHLLLENRLRQAIQNDQLVLHYQPVIDLRTGGIWGAEALVRWSHPELGLLPPTDFIPLAEMSGLILPIGRWVLNAACERLREWHDLGYSRLRLAVNVSPRQFQQPDFVADVIRAIAESGVLPSSLDIEITESGAMLDIEGTVEKLRELKRLDVRISLDDFGTGFASLNHLRRFPLDRIKLDYSFVKELPGNTDHCALARAVITMAHTLRLRIVGEGVETAEQLAFLRDEGCDEVQGYFVSKPLAASEFRALLERGPSALPPSAAKSSTLGSA